jgi:hypothetical protein
MGMVNMTVWDFRQYLEQKVTLCDIGIVVLIIGLVVMVCIWKLKH